jgi:release factor glutamine methyltransferase
VTVATARKALTGGLRDAGIDGAAGEADAILTRVLGCARAFLLAHPEREMTEAERRAVEEILRRRAAGEPLQYILKEACFWGRDFEVGPGVLIPRPETELLTELALEFDFSRFLDWGTGSGCIAATLLLERPGTRGTLAEKSPAALATAWKNLARHGLLGRALLWHSRAPEDIPCPERFGLVAGNPPYIPARELETLPREVRREPRDALDGGADGLDCFRLLFDRAPLWLKRGGALVLEIGGAEQAEVLKKMSPPCLELVEERPDYAGIPRCMAWRAR